MKRLALLLAVSLVACSGAPVHTAPPRLPATPEPQSAAPAPRLGPLAGLGAGVRRIDLAGR